MKSQSPLALLGLFAAVFPLPCWGEPVPAVLSLHEKDGRPYIKCSFDVLAGDCLWDSGSAHSIAPNMAPLSGYHPEAGKKDFFDKIKVQSVVFNGVEMGPALVLRENEAPPSLGMDLLAGKRVSLMAAPDLKLTLGAPIEQGLNRGRLELEDNRYIIEIELGERLVKALWDTGTAQTRVTRSTILLGPKEDFDRIGEFHTSKEAGGRFRARMLRVGGEDFPTQEVLETQNSPKGAEVLLGWDIIRQLDWSFDPMQKRWSASRAKFALPPLVGR